MCVRWSEWNNHSDLFGLLLNTLQHIISLKYRVAIRTPFNSNKSIDNNNLISSSIINPLMKMWIVKNNNRRTKNGKYCCYDTILYRKLEAFHEIVLTLSGNNRNSHFQCFNQIHPLFISIQSIRIVSFV